MRNRIVAILAYAGAALTLIIAACVPFYLMGAFTSVIGRAGLRIDPAYTGGTVARTIDRQGYQVVVYRPVYPHAMQRLEPFVQIDFKPADKLPAQVSEDLDLDGDGIPDVRVTFAISTNPHARLRGNVIALNGKYQSLTNVGGDSFSRLLVRTGNTIVVRVPLSPETASR